MTETNAPNDDYQGQRQQLTSTLQKIEELKETVESTADQTSLKSL
jgi:hypothetical protein